MKVMYIAGALYMHRRGGFTTCPPDPKSPAEKVWQRFTAMGWAEKIPLSPPITSPSAQFFKFREDLLENGDFDEVTSYVKGF